MEEKERRAKYSQKLEVRPGKRKCLINRAFLEAVLGEYLLGIGLGSTYESNIMPSAATEGLINRLSFAEQI